MSASGSPLGSAAPAHQGGSSEGRGRSMELLTAFDDAWVTYLEQFAAWKCADAVSLEVRNPPLVSLLPTAIDTRSLFAHHIPLGPYTARPAGTCMEPSYFPCRVTQSGEESVC